MAVTVATGRYMDALVVSDYKTAGECIQVGRLTVERNSRWNFVLVPARTAAGERPVHSPRQNPRATSERTLPPARGKHQARRGRD